MAPTDPQTATRRDIGRGLEGPDLAAHLAAQGYPLLPLAPRSKNPWGWLLIREGRTEDGERGSNKVLLRHPFSPADIRSLAAEFPTMQWGLLLDGSGIAVLDLDDVPGILKALGHAPPAGPTVATRRGLQVYMSLDGNRSGVLKGRTVFYAPGSGEQVGELKTAGFVVLPGSKHPKGGRYRWVTGLAMGEVPLLPVPDCLAERCRDKRRGNITHPCTPTRTREGLSSPQEPGPTEREKTESIQTSVYSPVLPLSVSPGGSIAWMRTGMKTYEAAGAAGYRLYLGGESVRGHAAETYPHACAVTLKGTLPPKRLTSDRQKLVWRAPILGSYGIKAGELSSVHLIDACLAALTGWLALRGTFVGVGDPAEGVILLPVPRLLTYYDRNLSTQSTWPKIIRSALGWSVRTCRGLRCQGSSLASKRTSAEPLCSAPGTVTPARRRVRARR